jgi:hypothetical protein
MHRHKEVYDTILSNSSKDIDNEMFTWVIKVKLREQEGLLTLNSIELM